MKLHPNLLLLLAISVDGSAADSIDDTLGAKNSGRPSTPAARSGRRRALQADAERPNNAAIWASNTQNVGKLCVMHLAYGNALQMQGYKRRNYLNVDNNGALLFPRVKTLSSTTITNPGAKVVGLGLSDVTQSEARRDVEEHM